MLRAVADAGSKDLAVIAAKSWAGDTERAAEGAALIDTQVLMAFMPILQEMGAFHSGRARRRAS